MKNAGRRQGRTRTTRWESLAYRTENSIYPLHLDHSAFHLIKGCSLDSWSFSIQDSFGRLPAPIGACHYSPSCALLLHVLVVSQDQYVAASCQRQRAMGGTNERGLGNFWRAQRESSPSRHAFRFMTLTFIPCLKS